jgi:hypothetical protein
VLRKREQRLMAGIWGAWPLSRLPLWLRGAVEFRRGFVTEARCSPVQMVSVGEMLLDSTPLEAVRLTGWFHYWLDEFLACPLLARLRTLHMAGNERGDEWTQGLASCPALGNLCRLDLRGNAIRDEGARALAQSPCLPRLDRLDLADNAIGDEGALALADSPFLADLSFLDLRGNPIGLPAEIRLWQRFGARLAL